MTDSLPTLALADGRTLGNAEWGDFNGGSDRNCGRIVDDCVADVVAVDGESRLEPELRRESAAMLARIAKDPATVLGDFDIPTADREILSRPEIAEEMVESLTACVRNGIWGRADDDIAVPTAVWWGEKDVLVPPQHGEWIVHTVPDALDRVDRSSGHQADADTDIEVRYAWLIHGTAWQD